MDKTFFIADTHFGDKNIIGYENRPFKNINEMDIALIDNWNGVVSDNDTVFLLGDFSSYEKEKNIQICSQLQGRKILVIGNHDTESEKYYYECGFASVCSYTIIYKNFWILSHEPVYINSNMPYANIFGHVHSNPIYSDYSKQSCCVSVERIKYTPLEFDQMRKMMSL